MRSEYSVRDCRIPVDNIGTKSEQKQKLLSQEFTCSIGRLSKYQESLCLKQRDSSRLWNRSKVSRRACAFFSDFWEK